MEKEFNVTRLTNGMGHSHLVVITEPAIEDVHIGTVVIVPYAEGFKEPSKVLLQVDEKGLPKRANGKFAIVSKYIVVLLILLSGCVSHRPRYNHWQKPYKMYEPVKQHKPNLK